MDEYISDSVTYFKRKKVDFRMKKKEIITYSGEELMQMELPPVRFVVKDFLSQGRYVRG